MLAHLATITTVRAFDAREDCYQTNRYVAAVNARIDQDPTGLSAASLWRLSSSTLTTYNVRIHTKSSRDFVMSGCYVDPGVQMAPPIKRSFEIKGLFRTASASSILPRLVVCNAIHDTADTHDEDVRFVATIRVFPDAWHDRQGHPHQENLASRNLFAEFGFVADGAPRRCGWLGDHRDHHLLTSLEPDGTYRNQLLRSTNRTVDLARGFLRKAHEAWGA